MTVLLAQIFLLLLGAFLLGATLACLLRRAIAGGRKEVDAVTVPITAVATLTETERQRPQDSARFERALVGEAGAGVPPPFQASSGPVVEVQPLPEPSPAPAPAPQPVKVAAPAPKVAPAPDRVSAPASASAPPAAKPASDYPAAIVAAAAASAAAAAAIVPAPVSTAIASAPSGPPDDLTRIRAIDAELQRRLNNLGCTRFADIAAWTTSDVTRVSQSLGFYGRIEHENWIEQAQILAKGGETDYSRRKSELPAQPPVPTLHRIIGITPPAEHILVKNGVTEISQVAAWTAADVAKFEGLLGDPGRIGRENWIEQARILSGVAGSAAQSAVFVAPIASEAIRVVGVDPETEETVLGNGDPKLSQIASWTSEDVARFDALQAASTSSPPSTVPPDTAPAPATAPVAESVSGAQPAEDNAPPAKSESLQNLRSVRSEALRGAGYDGAVSGVVDDLKRIRGVGILIEKKLNSLGITSYEQVANWTGADIERISQVLDFKGRIERENWIEQARILASGGQTEFSRRADRGEV